MIYVVTRERKYFGQPNDRVLRIDFKKKKIRNRSLKDTDSKDFDFNVKH